MKLLKTEDEHFKAAIKLGAGASLVIGSSFGIFSKWNMPGGVDEFLGSFDRGIFVIGNYETSLCRPGCAECREMGKKRIKRIIYQKERWPNHKWYITYDWHLKALCFKYPGGRYAAIVGGRNISDSGWSDLSIVLEGPEAKQIYNFVNRKIKEVADGRL